MLFKHLKGESILRALSGYYVPESVALHLDFISGVHHFPYLREDHTESRIQSYTIESLMEADLQLSNAPKIINQIVVSYYID